MVDVASPRTRASLTAAGSRRVSAVTSEGLHAKSLELMVKWWWFEQLLEKNERVTRELKHQAGVQRQGGQNPSKGTRRRGLCPAQGFPHPDNGVQCSRLRHNTNTTSTTFFCRRSFNCLPKCGSPVGSPHWGEHRHPRRGHETTSPHLCVGLLATQSLAPRNANLLNRSICKCTCQTAAALTMSVNHVSVQQSLRSLCSRRHSCNIHMSAREM